MDKKQYSRQASSKALSSDSRKSSDISSVKPWPKHPRRRENLNLTPAKNDNQRSGKAGPSKVRPNVDKRPRARGSGPNGTNNLNSASENLPSSSTGLTYEDEDDSESYESGRPGHKYYELNSVFLPGSKKQNLNHLLNFHYGPREFGNYSGVNGWNRSVYNRSHGKKHYNKEQFLQANFQFVVNAKAKLAITSSPDAIIDWDLIEQINIQTTEDPQCPICLYPPVAAKVTRCGHIYCWPCVLHYLALTDQACRRCPICYESIYAKHLKSSTIVQQIKFNVGDYINLHLMRRKKDSLYIEPCSTSRARGERSNDQFPLISMNYDATKFVKFLFANETDVLRIIEREENELAASNNEKDCPEFVFNQQALELLKERKVQTRKAIEMLPLESTKIDSVIEKLENCSIKEEQRELPDVSDGEHEIRTITDDYENTTKYYYFYQSTDGQNVFLHPLNVKMLQACYGSLEKAPLLINAKILQKEHFSMDEDHRKKFTCLGHLPLTCHFEVVEVELESQMVSLDVLKLFSDDILQRKKMRQRRSREEMKREIKINAINERQMGKVLSKSANIDLNSSHEFPTCGFEESLPTLRDNTAPVDIPIPSGSSKRNSYSSVANSSWGPMSSPSSINKGLVWPKEGSLAGSSHSKTSYNNVKMCEAGKESGEEICAPPNLGDFLAEAINQKRNLKAERPNGGKKNKKKKLLLFSALPVTEKE